MNGILIILIFLLIAAMVFIVILIADKRIAEYKKIDITNQLIENGASKNYNYYLIIYLNGTVSFSKEEIDSYTDGCV